MIKKAVESAMNAELTEHLGYEKHAVDGRGSGNSRNGTTSARVHTNVGPVGLGKPRDRNGEFDSKVVPKGMRRLGEFDDMVLSLFAKGMTTRDIAEHLKLTYDADISHETISNITDAINQTVVEWRNRPLEEGSTRSCSSTRSGCGSAPAGRSRSRPAIWPWAWISRAASGCWGCGSSRPRARSSGPGCSPSSATAASVTC